LELGNSCPFTNDRKLGGQRHSKATRAAAQSERKYYGKGRLRREGVQEHGMPLAEVRVEGEKMSLDRKRLLMRQPHGQIKLPVSY